MFDDPLSSAQSIMSIVLIIVIGFWAWRLYEIYNGGCGLDPFCIFKNWRYLVGKPGCKVNPDGNSICTPKS
jgi:hypothetical protein